MFACLIVVLVHPASFLKKHFFLLPNSHLWTSTTFFKLFIWLTEITHFSWYGLKKNEHLIVYFPTCIVNYFCCIIFFYCQWIVCLVCSSIFKVTKRMCWHCVLMRYVCCFLELILTENLTMCIDWHWVLMSYACWTLSQQPLYSLYGRTVIMLDIF